MEKKKPFLILMILLLVALFTYGCATTSKPCFKNGRDYSKTKYKIVTNDWDGCYLRGCSYLDGDCIDLAIAEFKKAIKDRAKDERLARPYGVRFMGYFPHRELGIIYYQMNRMEEAIEELEKSINDSPSSKASYFLNKARKAWLQKNDLDALPPQLDISFPPAPNYLTNKSVLTIKGNAEDDQFVSSLSVDEESIFIELSARHIPIENTIHLKRGLNKVLIAAGDLTGKKVEKKITIMVDRSAPLINLSYSLSEDALHKEEILLQGLLYDESGISEFTINDQPVVLSQKGKVSKFSYTISLSEVVKNISFLAVDKAGNKNSDFITLFSDTKRRRHVKTGIEAQRHKGTAAEIPHKKNGNYYAFQLNPWFKSKEIDKQVNKTHRKEKEKNLIKITSLGPPSLASFFAAPLKTAAVDETLLDDSESSPDTFLLLSKPLPKETIYNEIYLKGKIYYEKHVSSFNIIVNKDVKVQYDFGLPHEEETGLPQKRNKFYCLNEIIELDFGKNEIITEITNGKGKTRKETYYITKKEEEMLKRQYRLCVTVLPVEDRSPIHFNSPTILTYTSDELRNAFVKQQRFQVVNREKLDKILKELNYSTKDVFDKRNALKVGRQLIADALISGIICKNTNGKEEEFIELKGTITDVELTKDLYYEDICLGIDSDNIYAIISKAAGILAMKIRSNFPLCKGKVIDKKGLKIYVDIGHQCSNSPENDECNLKINEDTKLIVYREDEWAQNYKVARIERVFDEFSRAVLSKQNSAFDKIKNTLRKITSFIAPKSQANAYDGSIGTGELEVEIGDLVITK